MNAPATIPVPSSSARFSTMPFNLQPYSEGEFDKMHAAGSMLVSASNVFALFGAKPERLGRLAYAMHLTGQKPLPDISGEALIRVGHALEPLAADLLGEELGAQMIDHKGYSRHPWLDAFATPDRVCWIDGEPHDVELKIVTPKVYWDEWQGGKCIPRHVALQKQFQFACNGAKRGIIGVLPLNYCAIKHFEVEPHRQVIEKIEMEVDRFMSMLKRGDLPAPDDTEIDFDAFKELMSLGHEKKMISLESNEAARRAAQWFQAKQDEKAATATLNAHRRWFTRRMGRAEIATISPEFMAHWSTVGRAKGADKAHRSFQIKQPKGQSDE